MHAGQACEAGYCSGKRQCAEVVRWNAAAEGVDRNGALMGTFPVMCRRQRLNQGARRGGRDRPARDLRAQTATPGLIQCGPSHPGQPDQQWRVHAPGWTARRSRPPAGSKMGAGQRRALPLSFALTRRATSDEIGGKRASGPLPLVLMQCDSQLYGCHRAKNSPSKDAGRFLSGEVLTRCRP